MRGRNRLQTGARRPGRKHRSVTVYCLKGTCVVAGTANVTWRPRQPHRHRGSIRSATHAAKASRVTPLACQACSVVVPAPGAAICLAKHNEPPFLEGGQVVFALTRHIGVGILTHGRRGACTAVCARIPRVCSSGIVVGVRICSDTLGGERSVSAQLGSPDISGAAGGGHAGIVRRSLKARPQQKGFASYGVCINRGTVE